MLVERERPAASAGATPACRRGRLPAAPASCEDYAWLRLITCNQKALSKLRKESRPCSAISKMTMQHMRQALGRDLHRHFSLAPARSHTITASSKASATATRNPPPHPDPYKKGPKLAKRRRGHHTCHSSLSLPPAHLPPALPHSSPHLEPRVCTDGEGRRNSARLCATAVRRFGKQRSNRNRNRNFLPRPISSTHTSPLQLNRTVCTHARQSTDSVFTSSFEFRDMAIVAYASVN